jgi:hypothetical protein
VDANIDNGKTAAASAAAPSQSTGMESCGSATLIDKRRLALKDINHEI